MALTLADYRAAVQFKLEEVGTNKHFDPASSGILDEQINEAVRDIAKKTKCLVTKASVTTVVGTQEYSVPSDYHFYKHFAYSNQNKVIEYRDLTELNWETTDRSDPNYFTIKMTSDVEKIVLSPIPGSILTLQFFYYYMPADMTISTSVCKIPDRYKDVIVLLATQKLLYIDHQYSAALALEPKMQEKLDDMDSVSNQPGPKTVKNLMWDDYD